MACVLLGWELGANRGHITKLMPIVARLLEEGHEVHLALQQIDAGGLDLDPRIRLWQAPLWPRLLASLARPAPTPAATMADILARLGLERQGGLSSLIAGWESLFSAIRPDIVVADFAPSLLAAAWDRIESVLFGTGFTCPPSDLARFPVWAGMKPAHDEDELLDIADAELAISGRPALPSLAAIFRTDHALVTSFAELDPYAEWRKGGYVLPAVRDMSEAEPGGQGEEIFGYFINQIGPEMKLWEGLAASRRRVRLHMYDPSPAHIERFRALGLVFEPKPLPFARIVAQSRIVVSHGGHGFASAAILAGLPQMVTPFDLEKLLVGQGIREGGLGLDHSLFGVDPPAFGARLDAMCEDEALHATCRRRAGELAARTLPAPEDEIARFVSAAR